MICWQDYETELRQKRLAQSQPLNWAGIFGLISALLCSLAIWRVLWLAGRWLLGR